MGLILDTQSGPLLGPLYRHFHGIHAELCTYVRFDEPLRCFTNLAKVQVWAVHVVDLTGKKVALRRDAKPVVDQSRRLQSVRQEKTIAINAPATANADAKMASTIPENPG